MRAAPESGLRHRPSPVLLATEPARAVLDWLASAVHARPPRVGNGKPVLVLPGLGAHSALTYPLRWRLCQAGFVAHGWGEGVNTGNLARLDSQLHRMAERCRALQSRHGLPVGLVGWSLGGVIARELAKVVPDAVDVVVTLGSPVNFVPGSTWADALYQVLSGNSIDLPDEWRRRLKRPPSVARVNIFSKQDGVVGWQSSVELPAKDVRNVEVRRASHLGMTVNAEVATIVAVELARCHSDRLKRFPV